MTHINIEPQQCVTAKNGKTGKISPIKASAVTVPLATLMLFLSILTVTANRVEAHTAPTPSVSPTVSACARILSVYIQLTYTTISRTPHLDNICHMQHRVTNKRKVILTDTVNRIQNTEYIHLTSCKATSTYQTIDRVQQHLSRPVSWSTYTLSLYPISSHTDTFPIHTGYIPNITPKSLQYPIGLSSTLSTFLSRQYITVLHPIPIGDIITIRNLSTGSMLPISSHAEKLDIMHVTSNCHASYDIDNTYVTARLLQNVSVGVIMQIENIPYILHRKHMGHTMVFSTRREVTPIYIALQVSILSQKLETFFSPRTS